MKSEVFYLDDDNNIVDESVATKMIIREYDENYDLVNEKFMIKASSESEYSLSDEDLELIKEFDEKYSENVIKL